MIIVFLMTEWLACRLQVLEMSDSNHANTKILMFNQYYYYYFIHHNINKIHHYMLMSDNTFIYICVGMEYCIVLKGFTVNVFFKYVNRQNNHGRRFILYGHSNHQNTVYIYSPH